MNNQKMDRGTDACKAHLGGTKEMEIRQTRRGCLQVRYFWLVDNSVRGHRRRREKNLTRSFHLDRKSWVVKLVRNSSTMSVTTMLLLPWKMPLVFAACAVSPMVHKHIPPAVRSGSKVGPQLRAKDERIAARIVHVCIART